MDLLFGVALVLGVMILVHEWGHFIAARIFGVRVDVFSIGFGPRLFGWKRGATDWIKKPRWQRGIISFAGPLVNLVFPILLLTVYFVAIGIPYPAYQDKPVQVTGLPASSPAAAAGLKPGDKIVALDGEKNPDWEQVEKVISKVRPNSKLSVEV